MDGLSYRWWHGKDLIKVEFFGTPKADGGDGSVSYGAFDWRSIRGYLSYGHPNGKDPLLLLKINEALVIPQDQSEGWLSGSAMPSSFFPPGSTGNAVARTSFRLKPGALLEHPSAPILLQLDAETAALAEAQRLSDEQIRDRTLQEVVAAWNAGGPSSDRHTLLFRLREVEDVPDHVWEALLSDRLSGGDLLLPALVGEDIVSRRAAGFLCSADSGKAFMVVMDATINLFLAYDTDDPAAPEWV